MTNAVNIAQLNINGDTGAMKLPSGTAAQRPTAVAGLMRFNNAVNSLEYYTGSTWAGIGLQDGSTSVNAAPSATALQTTLLAFAGVSTSGVYWLKPSGAGSPFQAYVDFDTPNGPWVSVGTAYGGSIAVWAYPLTWINRTTDYGSSITDPTLASSSFNSGAFIYCKGSRIMIKEGGGNSGRGGSVGYTQCTGLTNESWRDMYSGIATGSWASQPSYLRLLTIDTTYRTVPSTSLIYGTDYSDINGYGYFIVYCFDGGGDTSAMLSTQHYTGNAASGEADIGFGANEQGPSEGGSPASPNVNSGTAYDAGSNGTIATGWSGVTFSLWIKN
jgi:hypothetical protein